MAEELSSAAVQALLPARQDTDHKGSFGHVLILAGSRGFTGAALLASEAAARSGVGLVTLGIPYALGDIIAASAREVMTLRLPCTNEETFALEARNQTLAAIDRREAVVLGPGVGTQPETWEYVYTITETCPKPLVLDADALNALAHRMDLLRNRETPTILTPHPGEMARLMNTTTDAVQNQREEMARELAKDLGHTVILKGHQTLIAAPNGAVWQNPTGNHGMATGGTGDVLSGLLGGLLAQNLNPEYAARIGVYLHGLAGDLAAEHHTARGMIASDLIQHLPQAWKALEQSP